MKEQQFTFVENIISNLQKIRRTKFLGSDRLFVLLAFASLAATKAILQQLQASLNLASEKTCSVDAIERSNFYELWNITGNWKPWT